MAGEKRYTNTLRVRIDPYLLELVKKEADKLNTDISTYVRWCIRTGLYLDDLNAFIRSKSKEDEDWRRIFNKQFQFFFNNCYFYLGNSSEVQDQLYIFMTSEIKSKNNLKIKIKCNGFGGKNREIRVKLALLIFIEYNYL